MITPTLLSLHPCKPTSQIHRHLPTGIISNRMITKIKLQAQGQISQGIICRSSRDRLSKLAMTKTKIEEVGRAYRRDRLTSRERAVVMRVIKIHKGKVRTNSTLTKY